MKTIIIGGVASGAACAARLRRLDEKAEIVIVERGPYISYANCGLPYFVGQKITSKEALLVMTPELMNARFQIDVRTETEAIAIDPESQTVTLRHEDRVYQESYDALVLATGASPFKPKIEGIDLPQICTLWSVPDAVQLHSWIQSAKHVAVLGGGFVGLELVENLKAQNCQVTMIEAAPQVMTALDPEMAALIHRELQQKGVELILSDAVQAFHHNESGLAITLSSGRVVEVDRAILSIGTRPNTELAQKAGIACNDRGFVIVDDQMQTSVPHIYAAGDIVVSRDLVFGEPAPLPLAGPAAKQGRIIADQLCDRKSAFSGVLGSSILKVFDLTAACTGANEKRLIAKGLQKGQDYQTILIRALSHVAFYPGAKPMFIKLIFSCDGQKIYGAQIVGEEGVDKRIDVIATLMRMGGGIEALKNLELAYAPPFGAAKDPVNMAGFVAGNVAQGLIHFADYRVTPDEAQFLDVREEGERSLYRLPNAVEIPLGELRQKLETLDRQKPYVIFCAVGVRAYNAARILMQHGFENISIYPGGLAFYRQMHDPIAQSDPKEKPTLSSTSFKATGPADVKLDCCGLQCPGPLMKVYEAVKELKDGEKLEVTATDAGFARDIDAWCRRMGHKLLQLKEEENGYRAVIQKNAAQKPDNSVPATAPKGQTMVVFSGDFDKVMAAFIIANGAAAMGQKVTLFFTFWGLTALRRSEPVEVKKSFMERLFGFMLPRGFRKLGLSRMNMGGLGGAMMKKIMQDKKVNSLEELAQSAMANGVRLQACSMSMDVMGIHPEELIDGVEIVGVGSYLDSAADAHVNLFL